MEVLTCIAPVNIATIKYWGKRDENLILPLNDSVSITLSTNQMHAKTTVAHSPNFTSDQLWLNGVEQTTENPRFKRIVEEIRKRSNLKNVESSSWKLLICSENNFPTAAGLASSAAGYACLVYALAQLYKVNGDISKIARMGSGSACRSIYGGFVQWHAGIKDDGSDSFAEQLFPSYHWPELHIVILVVNDAKKKVASTAGMQLSVETSELLKFRVENTVPKHVDAIKKAIEERNFAAFAEITMRDSNQMHATALDSYPPIIYMSYTSHAIIDFVHNYNKCHGEIKAAYTFDAGPNACIFLLEKDVSDFIAHVRHSFPPGIDNDNYIRGLPVKCEENLNMDIFTGNGSPPEKGSLKYIIHTKIGEGPVMINGSNEHLIDENGLPKSLNTNFEA